MNDLPAFAELKLGFNNRIQFRERKDGLFQIIAPVYHEDGDMYDVFIEQIPNTGNFRISDRGLTLMRLSYTYELDTPKKNAIFDQILLENKISNDEGNLYIDAIPGKLYQAYIHFTHVISKITNMQVYRKDVIKNLFYEDLEEIVKKELAAYPVIREYLPIHDHEEYAVDYRIMAGTRQIFLFGVKDNEKALRVAVSCLEYQKRKLPFRSVIVYQDMAKMAEKNLKIITNAVDKQFTDLSNFQTDGGQYIEREVSA
jgi:hypothetical protein